jgi:hypothetical protein
MKNIRRNTIVLVVFLSLVFALSFVGQSQAADKSIVLKGTYAVVGEQICVAHWTQSPIPNDILVYWTKTETLQGTVTFNPDGTGIATVSLVTMAHPIYTPIPTYSYWLMPIPSTLPYGSIVTSHITNQFTYTIDPVTRIITRTVTGTPVGQFTTGTISGYPALGKWFTFNPFTFTGYISKNLKTIVFSSAPDDEYGDHYLMTIDLYNDQNMTSLFAVEQDVCQRTRVLTLIEK